MSFVFRTWGGARKNAGRKPAGLRAGVPHAPRGALGGREPVHVTLHARPGVPSLRSQVCFRELRRAFSAGKERFGFRLAHFSVQSDHIHLIVEAADKRALARGMQGLGIRMARGINGAVGRTGRVFADRYHAKPLGSPTQVRNAIVYVLRNVAKHDVQGGGRITDDLDACSSARYFVGWRARPPSADEGEDDPEHGDEPPVVAPRTWLLARGWQVRGGLIRSIELPRM